MPDAGLPQRFQVVLADQTYQVEIQGDTLLVDGVELDHTFQSLGDGSYILLLDGRSRTFVIEDLDQHRLRLSDNRGRRVEVQVKDEAALLMEQFGIDTLADTANLELRAPMPGLVLSIQVDPGQAVEKGQGLLVLEAMKMENELRAPVAASVEAIHVKAGDAVSKNDLLIQFKPA